MTFVCGCISLCVVGDDVRVWLYQSLSGVVGDGLRVWLYQPAPSHHRVGEHQLAGGGRVPPGPVAGVQLAERGGHYLLVQPQQR